jgi:hypothetical protein
LQPPNGVAEIEFHRFSPFHNNPEAFGIQLRPHEKYFFIYPFDEKTIAGLAYLFELEGQAPGDLSYLRSIKQAVRKWKRVFKADTCTLTWQADGDEILIDDRRPGFVQRRYRLRDHAAKVFQQLDQPAKLKRLVQRETTALAGVAQGAEEMAFELPVVHTGAGGYNQTFPTASSPSIRVAEARLPVSFGDPIGRANVSGDRREVHVAFDAEAFNSNPAGCLKPILEAGIIFEEDGYYLSLPVKHDYRSFTLGWTRLGI